tara:strand:- start:43 stop:645 length:603 start_codon:yes stop_codon:yes gene_type:complete
MLDYKVSRISYESTKPYILGIHYAKRMPSISFSFGLFEKEQLVGIVTYGSPPSPSLCKGICGVEYKSKVLELNRLCLKNNKKNEASFLVGKSLKLLRKPSIIVSYADTDQNHVGYIYQATNFIYTGLSDKRTEWKMTGNDLHSKTVCEKYSLQHRKENPELFYVADRPRKHRYIYMIGNKKETKNLLENLKYSIKPYPKN